MGIYAYGFRIDLSKNIEGVYLLVDRRKPLNESVLYVGKTTNLKNRLYKHTNKESYDISYTITDIYFIKVSKKYLSIIEIILIGIFLPKENKKLYKLGDKWRGLFRDNAKYEIEYLAKCHYYEHLSVNDSVLKIMGSLEYAAFHKRYDRENMLVYNRENFQWYHILDNNLTYSISLKKLMESYLSKSLNR